MLQPAAGRVLALLAGDLRLQELADRGPVLGRPGISGLEQAATGLGQAGWGLAGRPPHQAQPHAGGGGPFLKLGVHGQHLPFGGCDQFLEGAGHLGDEVGFEDLTLVCGKDARQFADLDRQRLGEFGYGSLSALVDDVHDHPVLDHTGRGGVAVP